MPVINHSSIVAQKMNGLRRNDDAIKTDAGIQIIKSKNLKVKNGKQLPAFFYF
ncbi:MAG TPA: hypothetical protein VHZ50_00095 [Puia sp.]|jgi:thymidine phosphorylase|nr:hypothetical protein [Puia sp.]